MTTTTIPGEPAWRTKELVALCKEVRESEAWGRAPEIAELAFALGYPDSAEASLVVAAMPDAPPMDVLKAIVQVEGGEAAAAQVWLTEFAHDEFEGMSLGMFVDALANFVKTGDTHTLGFDTPSAVYEMSEAMWEKYEAFTGRPGDRTETDPDGGRYRYASVPFSCSC